VVKKLEEVLDSIGFNRRVNERYGWGQHVGPKKCPPPRRFTRVITAFVQVSEYKFFNVRFADCDRVSFM
jgi:hypothetical protein